MSLLTRAEMRDEIRRMIGILPPIDLVPSIGALPGAQPSNYPVPTNQQINSCLTNAISNINRECQYHVNVYNVPVAAGGTSTYGPYAISMEDFTPNTSATAIFTPSGLVNNILRVLWTPQGGQPNNLIQPISRDNLDRSGVSNYQNLLPSQPTWWYVEGYTVYITPAQDAAGTYTFTCGTGLVGLQTDADVLDQCPDQYQNTFYYETIKLIGMANPQDVELQSLVQTYGQMAEAGKRDWKAWRHNNSGAQQASLLLNSYRNTISTRRIQR